VVLQLLVVVPTGAAQSDMMLGKLRTNTKLHAPDAVLADFVNGESETGVIVHLKPTVAANALAITSKISQKFPAQFSVPGAPAYYNRGICYLKLNRLEEACNDWKQAMKFGNEDAINKINQFCK